MKTIQKTRPERETARLASQPTYFTGRPCKHGHIVSRNTSDASCTECRRLFVESRREEAKSYSARYRDTKRKEMGETAWKKHISEQRSDYRKRNVDKARAQDRKNSRLKRQRYPEKKRAECRARQAAKLQRTPVWADLKEIEKFYANCPDGYEVDHITPLRGKDVSGLHVIENLQYLTPAQNRVKGNRFDAHKDL